MIGKEMTGGPHWLLGLIGQLPTVEPLGSSRSSCQSSCRNITTLSYFYHFWRLTLTGPEAFTSSSVSELGPRADMYHPMACTKRDQAATLCSLKISFTWLFFSFSLSLKQIHFIFPAFQRHIFVYWKPVLALFPPSGHSSHTSAVHWDMLDVLRDTLSISWRFSINPNKTKTESWPRVNSRWTILLTGWSKRLLSILTSNILIVLD